MNDTWHKAAKNLFLLNATCTHLNMAAARYVFYKSQPYDFFFNILPFFEL